jgi:hypothetical protein
MKAPVFELHLAFYQAADIMAKPKQRAAAV